MYLLTYFWAFAPSSSSSWTRGARAVVEDLKFSFVGCDAIVSARATYLPTLPTYLLYRLIFGYRCMYMSGSED